MQQPPGHGTDAIEELERPGRLLYLDGLGALQQLQVRAAFQCRTVGDAPMVHPVTPLAPMTLG